MMPLLFSLFQQTPCLEEANRLTPGEHLLAFLDDTFLVSPPHKVVMEECGIKIHVGKTQLWNRAGARPIVCDRLEPFKQSTARVCVAGSLLPTDQIKVLGTPLGHPDFVARHLQAVVGTASHE